MCMLSCDCYVTVTCSGGWSREGCEVTEANSTAVSCRCSHLTAFAVLLPRAAFEVSPTESLTLELIPPLPPLPSPPLPPVQPLPPPVAMYQPSIFVYVVLGCVCALYVVTLLVLCCVSTLEGLIHNVNKNLVLSLLLATLAFMTLIDRTENTVNFRASRLLGF